MIVMMGKQQIIVNDCTQMFSACDNTKAQVILVTGGFSYSGSGSFLSSTEVSLSSGKSLKW